MYDPLLYSEFGSGKSEWARAFIRARTATADLEVLSPTFVLSVQYPVPAAVGGGSIHHMDLCRLASEKDTDMLEINEALQKGT
jgi:tRNA A37 threonylcarbamoyladenosine biosynthesis protein TsaE